jgi:hypothetical protein
MQSYVDFVLIPRNLANSSPTCMDKRPNFGHIAEKLPISVHIGKEKGSPLRA